MSCDNLLDSVEDHVLVLVDAHRHILDDVHQAVVVQLLIVQLAIVTDSIEDRRDDQREELSAVFLNMRHDIVDASENCLVVVSKG